jgi:hypothetical protein
MIIALMMEAASTSKTFVNIYQTTQSYNPEDSLLNTEKFLLRYLFYKRYTECPKKM